MRRRLRAQRDAGAVGQPRGAHFHERGAEALAAGGRHEQVEQENARRHQMRAHARQRVARLRGVGQALEGARGDERGGVPERQVERMHLLAHEGGAKPARRHARPTRFDERGRRVDPVNRVARAQEWNEQSARPAHELEHVAVLARQSLRVPVELAVADGRSLGVVEERRKRRRR
jgi:hypothetical protein